MRGREQKKQGKNEKNKKQRESRDQGTDKCDDPRMALSEPQLANAKTKNRRDYPSAPTPIVKRKTCRGN
jgi:hypothetical protein